jgi:hypothetical protein
MALYPLERPRGSASQSVIEHLGRQEFSGSRVVLIGESCVTPTFEQLALALVSIGRGLVAFWLDAFPARAPGRRAFSATFVTILCRCGLRVLRHAFVITHTKGIGDARRAVRVIALASRGRLDLARLAHRRVVVARVGWSRHFLASILFGLILCGVGVA